MHNRWKQIGGINRSARNQNIRAPKTVVTGDYYITREQENSGVRFSDTTLQRTAAEDIVQGYWYDLSNNNVNIYRKIGSTNVGSKNPRYPPAFSNRQILDPSYNNVHYGAGQYNGAKPVDISQDGNMLVVGDAGDGDNYDGSDTGKIYTYLWDDINNEWSKLAWDKDDDSNHSNSDEYAHEISPITAPSEVDACDGLDFGYTMSLFKSDEYNGANSILAVSSGVNSCYLYFYRFDGRSWNIITGTLQGGSSSTSISNFYQYATNNNPNSDGLMGDWGYSLSLSAVYNSNKATLFLTVGCPNVTNSVSDGKSGAYLYTIPISWSDNSGATSWNGNAIRQNELLSMNYSSHAGFSVASMISGTYTKYKLKVAAGIPDYNDRSKVNAGQVFFYTIDSNNNDYSQYILPPSSTEYANFGYSVSFDKETGNNLLITSPFINNANTNSNNLRNNNLATGTQQDFSAFARYFDLYAVDGNGKATGDPLLASSWAVGTDGKGNYDYNDGKDNNGVSWIAFNAGGLYEGNPMSTTFIMRCRQDVELNYAAVGGGGGGACGEAIYQWAGAGGNSGELKSGKINMSSGDQIKIQMGPGGREGAYGWQNSNGFCYGNWNGVETYIYDNSGKQIVKAVGGASSANGPFVSWATGPEPGSNQYSQYNSSSVNVSKGGGGEAGDSSSVQNRKSGSSVIYGQTTFTFGSGGKGGTAGNGSNNGSGGAGYSGSTKISYNSESKALYANLGSGGGGARGCRSEVSEQLSAWGMSCEGVKSVTIGPETGNTDDYKYYAGPGGPGGVVFSVPSFFPPVDFTVDFPKISNGFSSSSTVTVNFQYKSGQTSAYWKYSLDGGNNWTSASTNQPSATFNLNTNSQYTKGQIIVQTYNENDVQSNPQSNPASFTVDTAGVPEDPVVDFQGMFPSGNTDGGYTNKNQVGISNISSGFKYTLDGQNNWSTLQQPAGYIENIPDGIYNPGVIGVLNVDEAGQTNGTVVSNQYTIIIDTKNPNQPNLDFDSTESDGVVGVTLNTDDGGISWEYSSDGGVNWSSSNADSFTVLSSVGGTKYVAGQIQVRSIDKAGNKSSEASNPNQFIVDTTVVPTPAVTFPTLIDVSGANYTGNNQVDVDSGIASYWEYSVDKGSSWTRITVSDSSPTYFILDDGSYDVEKIQVRSSDGQNVSAVISNSKAFTVDTTAPGTPGVTFPDSGSNIVTIDSLPGANGYKYSRDGGNSFKTINSDTVPAYFVLNNQEYEAYDIQVVSIDELGNMSQTVYNYNRITITPPSNGLNYGTPFYLTTKIANDDEVYYPRIADISGTQDPPITSTDSFDNQVIYKPYDNTNTNIYSFVLKYGYDTTDSINTGPVKFNDPVLIVPYSRAKEYNNEYPDQVLYTDNDNNSTWINTIANIDNANSNNNYYYTFFVKAKVNNGTTPMQIPGQFVTTDDEITFGVDTIYSNSADCGWYGCRVTTLNPRGGSYDFYNLNWGNGGSDASGMTLFNTNSSIAIPDPVEPAPEPEPEPAPAPEPEPGPEPGPYDEKGSIYLYKFNGTDFTNPITVRGNNYGFGYSACISNKYIYVGYKYLSQITIFSHSSVTITPFTTINSVLSKFSNVLVCDNESVVATSGIENVLDNGRVNVYSNRIPFNFSVTGNAYVQGQLLSTGTTKLLADRASSSLITNKQTNTYGGELLPLQIGAVDNLSKNKLLLGAGLTKEGRLYNNDNSMNNFYINSIIQENDAVIVYTDSWDNWEPNQNSGLCICPGNFNEAIGMRLDASGNVGIGTSSPKQKLDVTGNINFTGNLYQNGSIVSLSTDDTTTISNLVVSENATISGDLTVSGDIIGTVSSSSDLRLKTNIQPIDNALDKVIMMNGVYFEYISDEDKKQNVGVIAQDVEKVLPQVVVTNKENDMKSVCYDKLVGVLIEAVKELNKKVDNLQEKIYLLENK